ncbi:MAG: 1-pyrroline-5-carboxylate dehydrogenase [Ignavibacteriae bacterium HGW-Ignavibacteriae-3]|nr:MAG: 1-pyrroline-5-carboxylate dehydrogenase [Ignavibacteriae bacterium HGW-Ignavibacteriae-3]
MPNAIFNLPLPPNEEVKDYAPGSPERALLKAKLSEMENKQIEIPLIIGGKEIRTGKTANITLPHNHRKIIGKYHKAGPKEVQMAIDAAMEAYKTWSVMEWQDRAAIFSRAADMITLTDWRYTINASTMLGQSKNVHQAEIDAACETADFFRFNIYYANKIYQEQPPHSPHGMWNRMEYRPLEGFVFAIAPFNFTTFNANLPGAPAIMGNVTILKPAGTSVLSAYYIVKLLEAAGLPAGVINFLPGQGSMMGDIIFNDKNFAGLHFTGSTAVFQQMWKTIGNNISKYKTYPRIVGETGGKDFVFAHKSTDVRGLGVSLIQGAFEYQGQKCSAASRAYIPKSVWPELKEYLVTELKKLKTGDVTDFSNYNNAVIDKAAYDSITGYIKYAKESNEAEIIVGGKFNDKVGYYINPTIIVTTNPKFKTMEEEIFGPVLTVYIYEDEKYEETLHLCDDTSPYALTGAIFAQDRSAIVTADRILKHASGNFYINDKPTGAVVGQQPFGGARGSGTNDKAGSFLNMVRWVSPRTIKENFVARKDFRYPFMLEK